MRTVIRCRGLARHFMQGSVRVDVIRDIDLDIYAGEQLAIVGTSGAGKSTLLHLLGALDSPSGGEIEIDSRPLAGLGEAERGRLRNRFLGFIYQFHHLLPEFSALENVAMPLLIRRDPASSAFKRAAELLERVGLGHRLTHKPGELSGGERQRAAFARALSGNPGCVLADEPTGNLDGQTAASIYDLMCEMNTESGTSFVVVTHDLDLASRMQRIVHIEDGRIISSQQQA